MAELADAADSKESGHARPMMLGRFFPCHSVRIRHSAWPVRPFSRGEQEIVKIHRQNGNAGRTRCKREKREASSLQKTVLFDIRLEKVGAFQWSENYTFLTSRLHSPEPSLGPLQRDDLDLISRVPMF
jgi:hypothetical protein